MFNVIFAYSFLHFNLEPLRLSWFCRQFTVSSIYTFFLPVACRVVGCTLVIPIAPATQLLIFCRSCYCCWYSYVLGFSGVDHRVVFLKMSSLILFSIILFMILVLFVSLFLCSCKEEVGESQKNSVPPFKLLWRFLLYIIVNISSVGT